MEGFTRRGPLEWAGTGFWELRPGVGGGDGVPRVAVRGVVGAVGHDVAEEVENGVEPVGAGRPGNGGAEGTSCGGVEIPPMISVLIVGGPLLDAPLLLVSLVIQVCGTEPRFQRDI